MKPIAFALSLIAACAIHTGAGAAKVYRCGNTYSEVPCPDGEELSTTNGPSAALQKSQQRETRKIEKAADQMEKERLSEERALAKAQQKEREATEKARQADERAARKDRADEEKKASKGTLYFTAKSPATKASQPK